MKLTSELKKQLIETCQKEVLEKINLCHNSLEEIKKDISNETKSSAGDKFETSREMMQQEREKTEVQLQRLKRTVSELNQISGKKHSIIENGSLIRSGTNYFFFFSGLSNLTFKGQKIYTVAITSPLGQQLKGKNLKMKAEFRGKLYTVDEIC